MNRRARKFFEVGQDVAGALVLEVVHRDLPRSLEIPRRSRTLAYRVRCVHCGHERTLSHSAMVSRAANGEARCRACASPRVRAKRAKISHDEALRIALGAWR
jgi:ribosomal protein S27E